ncbi:hypothetical protein [Ferrovibrio sp.]|uniref:hypothetical protein n=1 Tax=Ferrovibrio sp. TaxID=1917215 RepID=UPI00262B62F2|nr:hypothetical protein [Ferrovibrio sp.]
MHSWLTPRCLLRFDAALCLACGLPGLLAAGWTAKFLLPVQTGLFGLPLAGVMLGLGVALAAYAILLAVMSVRPARGFTTFTILADGLWVLGTLALLLGFGAAFSKAGVVVLLVIAADTALIGVLKARALRLSGGLAAG